MRRSSSGRYEWMDLTRGIAIVLVIVFHASAVPLMLDQPMPGWVVQLNELWQPFRMPALLVLSGLLLGKSLAKGASRYYLGKVQHIVWPFAVWLVLDAAIGGDPLQILTPERWVDGGYLWYLSVIACCYLIGPVTRFVPPLALAVIMLVLSLELEEMFWHRFLYFGAFFFLGSALASVAGYLDRIPMAARLGLLAVSGAWALHTVAEGIYPHYLFEGFWISAVGVLAIVLFAPMIPKSRLTDGVEWVGRNSMVFYVAHFPVLIVVTKLLVLFDAYRASLALLIGTLAAFAVSVLLTIHRHRPALAWLFEMPSIERVGSLLGVPQPASPATPEVAGRADSAPSRSLPRPASAELRSERRSRS